MIDVDDILHGFLSNNVDEVNVVGVVGFHIVQRQEVCVMVCVHVCLF